VCIIAQTRLWRSEYRVFVEMEARYDPSSAEWCTIAERAKLVKKWTLRNWQPLLTSLAARLMNATNCVGRHVDWLQSLSPQQIPHCPDRRCQIYQHSGVNAELTRQKLYHARLMHAS
jgi:hypothetical protein